PTSQELRRQELHLERGLRDGDDRRAREPAAPAAPLHRRLGMSEAIRYRGPRHLDRTLSLELGEVPVAGVELEVELRPTIDGGLEALLEGSCDAAEIPLGALLSFVARGDRRLTG